MDGYGPRRGFGFLGILVTLILVGIVAAVAYNLGVSAGVAPGQPAPVGYPYYWFGGFHVFGFLFFLLIIGLILAAVFRPRRWGHHGWYGAYGPGPWGPRSEMRDVPPPFEPMLENWHRRAHGETPADSGAGGPAQPKS